MGLCTAKQGVNTTVSSGPAVRKSPFLPLFDPDVESHFLLVPSVRDLYIDDIEEIYSAIAGVCEDVTTESEELEKITLDNITDIRREKLVGFRIEGSNPGSVTVFLRTKDPLVLLSVYGKGGQERRVFEHLEKLLRSRQRRILGLTYSTLRWISYTGVGLLLLAAILGMAYFDSPWPIVAAGAVGGIWVLIADTLLFQERTVVVYPVWRRDAAPKSGINWKEQTAHFLQSLLILLIGFLLGRYLQPTASTKHVRTQSS